MKWVMDNWSLLVVVLSTIIVIAIRVANYLKLSDEEKAATNSKHRDATLKALSDWLLIAVTEAEKDLGSGTGKLKLRAVYEKAISLFGPELADMITLEQLDQLLQVPLEQMRNMLDSNANIRDYVDNGGTNNANT